MDMMQMFGAGERLPEMVTLRSEDVRELLDRRIASVPMMKRAMEDAASATSDARALAKAANTQRWLSREVARLMYMRDRVPADWKWKLTLSQVGVLLDQLRAFDETDAAKARQEIELDAAAVGGLAGRAA